MKYNIQICKIRVIHGLSCCNCKYFDTCKGSKRAKVEEDELKKRKVEKEKEKLAEIKLREKLVNKQEVVKVDRVKRCRKMWTDEELQIVNNPDIPIKVAALRLNRSKNSIYKYRKRNNIISNELDNIAY